MAKTVVGLFDHIEKARDVVQDLIENGYKRENISLIANDTEGRHAQDPGLETDREEPNDAISTGAGIGAALGGIGGLLVGIGAFMIPGVGPIIGAGPLVAALGGAGVGALAGGLVGGLTGSGVPEKDASIFAEGVRRGGTLVLVYTEDQAADRAANLLNRHEPVDIERQSAEWTEKRWNGFNDSPEQFAFDQPKQPYHERSASSTLDFGPGARTYLSGQPVSDYERGAADLSNYQDEPMNDRLMVESSFRENFERRFAASGKKWEDYRDSYRFGFDRGKEGPYANAEWDNILTQVRQHWERDFPDRRWEDHEEAIYEGWHLSRPPR